MKKIINYSNLPGLLIFAALVIIPISCSKDAVKDNSLPDNSSQLIKISCDDTGADTKTYLSNYTTVWNGGDQIGVYCPEAQVAGGRVNVPYIAQETVASSSFTGAMKWGGTSTLHNFYAYYPYAVGSPAATAIPISLSAAQTQLIGNNSSHLGALDFLVANPMLNVLSGTVDQATTVNLHFSHVFAIIEFQITGSTNLKAVKLIAPNNIAFTGGSINITQTPTSDAYTIASMTVPTQEVVVTLTNAATLDHDNATKVYMVVNPGTQTGSCMIGISTAGGDWSYISKAVPTSGKFTRGKKYVVTIHHHPVD